MNEYIIFIQYSMQKNDFTNLKILFNHIFLKKFTYLIFW